MLKGRLSMFLMMLNGELARSAPTLDLKVGLSKFPRTLMIVENRLLSPKRILFITGIKPTSVA